MTIDERVEILCRQFCYTFGDTERRRFRLVISSQLREAVEEENRLGRLAVEMAQRQAYENAAKIADVMPYAGIAAKIRARANEVLSD